MHIEEREKRQDRKVGSAEECLRDMGVGGGAEADEAEVQEGEDEDGEDEGEEGGLAHCKLAN